MAKKFASDRKPRLNKQHGQAIKRLEIVDTSASPSKIDNLFDLANDIEASQEKEKEKRKRDAEKRKAARERQKAVTEAAERAQYEKLKEKYGE